MTIEKMKNIISKEIPFSELIKNGGIYEFYQEGHIGIGISYEDDENKKDIYIFNLFYNDEYINISGTGINDGVIKELVENWNKLLMPLYYDGEKIETVADVFTCIGGILHLINNNGEEIEDYIPMDAKVLNFRNIENEEYEIKIDI